ncbi:hypothetical protein V5O48_018679 [Marasmius crinis-equi]|uniref:Uncharacterized protein n=1 Tax=Marasmius crinis-equi TaxID=585013 RepID=A0ABR3EKI2_9AGAR
MLALITGLAPTLIIVRIAYNKSVESVNSAHQKVSSLHFKVAGRSDNTGSTTINSTGPPSSMELKQLGKETV